MVSGPLVVAIPRVFRVHNVAQPAVFSQPVSSLEEWVRYPQDQIGFFYFSRACAASYNHRRVKSYLGNGIL